MDVEDTFGNTPLICAAENGHVNLVLLFLAQGADVNRVTHSGSTALHYAAKHGWTTCCKVNVFVKSRQTLLVNISFCFHLSPFTYLNAYM